MNNILDTSNDDEYIKTHEVLAVPDSPINKAEFEQYPDLSYPFLRTMSNKYVTLAESVVGIKIEEKLTFPAFDGASQAAPLNYCQFPDSETKKSKIVSVSVFGGKLLVLSANQA